MNEMIGTLVIMLNDCNRFNEIQERQKYENV